MSEVEKLLLCLSYCKEQHENSGGEILSELNSTDFEGLYHVITTMLEEE